MNVTKIEYTIEKFNEENVEIILKDLGLNTNNYLMTMPTPSLLSLTLIGSVSLFYTSRYCIICFSETELNLIKLSRVNAKKATELLKIDRTDIKKMKLSNKLFSYTLNITTCQSTMEFQVFKKMANFTKLDSSLNLFKKIYNI